MAKNKSKNSVKYNIICLSNQLWDFPNWTNKRHVMSRLSKAGHSVIFVDPPINFGRVFLTQVKKGLWNLKRFINRYKIDKPDIAVFTPLNFLPFSEITANFHIKKIKKLANKLFVHKRKTVLWIYHVQIAELQKYLEALDYDVLVYDCVDNYEGFPQENTFYATNVYKDALIKQEQKLAEKATVVFASAPGLVDKMKRFNVNVFYTPNVGDFQRFKNTKSYKYKLPDDLAKISRPRVGMIGAMDEYKFDAELVRKCALAHPEYSFVLIGPIALKDKETTIDAIGLSGIDNIYYLGSKPYEDKKYYLAGFDVDIIPYQLNDYTVGGCFPVKFHDSLAAGLPVVVTNLPAYAPFEDVCYISKSHEEFCTNIKKALDEDNEKRFKIRQEVARVNDWDNKVEKMMQIISSKAV